jgi:hypothetical protein
MPMRSARAAALNVLSRESKAMIFSLLFCIFSLLFIVQKYFLLTNVRILIVDTEYQFADL